MEYIKKLRDFGFNTDNHTYIIAEVGINHEGDINLAKRLIESVARTGADAVKFQTYLTEKRVPKDSPIFDILKKCELPFEAFAELKDYANELSLDFFSTPFDSESVDYLQSINCDLYKIASFDVVNKKLLKKISETQKPVIMSIGMANMDEVNEAYEILKSKTSKIAILHCISSYPTIEEDANLSVIYKLKESFDCLIGQSDHTNDILVPLYAVAAGAQILEKHFKIDENMDCIDSAVSITEKQLKELVNRVRKVEKIFGDVKFGVRSAEKEIAQYRRFN
jgi:N,N'-diacetyllegionaminate synthase